MVCELLIFALLSLLCEYQRVCTNKEADVFCSLQVQVAVLCMTSFLLHRPPYFHYLNTDLDSNLGFSKHSNRLLSLPVARRYSSTE